MMWIERMCCLLAALTALVNLSRAEGHVEKVFLVENRCSFSIDLTVGQKKLDVGLCTGAGRQNGVKICTWDRVKRELISVEFDCRCLGTIGKSVLQDHQPDLGRKVKEAGWR